MGQWKVSIILTRFIEQVDELLRYLDDLHYIFLAEELGSRIN